MLQQLVSWQQLNYLFIYCLCRILSANCCLCNCNCNAMLCNMLSYLLPASCTVDKRESARERGERESEAGERSPDLDQSVARLIEPLVRFYCHNKSIFTVQQFVALPENNLQPIVACCIVCCNTCNARAVGCKFRCSLRWRLSVRRRKLENLQLLHRVGRGGGRHCKSCGRGRVYDFLIDLAAIRKCYAKCMLA